MPRRKGVALFTVSTALTDVVTRRHAVKHIGHLIAPFLVARGFASKVDFGGTSFVFSSCDFVDRCVFTVKQGRSTKSHEPTRTKIFRIELDVTFEAKPPRGAVDSTSLSSLYDVKLRSYSGS